ncbi:YrbL family protein [Sulfurimonas sp. HSL3-7]|uniref:YrbL family protein n=1 Tax=Sulfonitrofixus jiaomeiensis TaxID=3131938 RepID=UPI0031F9A4F2
MSTLRLNESLLLGKGNERLCYVHPDDPSKIIKVPYKQLNARDQNRLEELYAAYLERKGVSFEHITRCYGSVDVEGKKGLVFDRVINSDGSVSRTFSDIIRQQVITPEQAKVLLDDLQAYLVENNILFVDVSLDNIMCRHEEDGSYRLIIVDGLGARRPGFKFWLYRHFPPYAAYKVKHQWPKVMRNFEKLLKELAAN